MRSLRSTSNGCCLSFFSTFERARKKGSTGRTRTASSRSGTPHTHCRRSPSPSPSRAPKQRRSRCRPMQHRLARARPPWRRAATGGRASPRITSDEAPARASSGGTGAAVEEPATTLRVSRLCSCGVVTARVRGGRVASLVRAGRTNTRRVPLLRERGARIFIADESSGAHTGLLYTDRRLCSGAARARPRTPIP